MVLRTVRSGPALPPWPPLLCPAYQAAPVHSSAPVIRSLPQGHLPCAPLSPGCYISLPHVLPGLWPLAPSVCVYAFVSDAVLLARLHSPEMESSGCTPLGITGTCLCVRAESVLGTLFVVSESPVSHWWCLCFENAGRMLYRRGQTEAAQVTSATSAPPPAR